MSRDIPPPCPVPSPAAGSVGSQVIPYRVHSPASSKILFEVHYFLVYIPDVLHHCLLCDLLGRPEMTGKGTLTQLFQLESDNRAPVPRDNQFVVWEALGCGAWPCFALELYQGRGVWYGGMDHFMTGMRKGEGYAPNDPETSYWAPPLNSSTLRTRSSIVQAVVVPVQVGRVQASEFISTLVGAAWHSGMVRALRNVTLASCVDWNKSFRLSGLVSGL